MNYSDETIEEIKKQLSGLLIRHNDLFLRTVRFANQLKNDRAKEYALHGISRRLNILRRCALRIFELFPANRVDKLIDDDRQDVTIYLHAFLINIFGILENAALALAYEHDMFGSKSQGKLHFREVNLFNKRFQSLLNPKLRQYLVNEKICKWYQDYAKNYRDALAHRIPPYIAPAALKKADQERFKVLSEELQGLTYEKNLERIDAIYSEQISLGSSNPLFVHSFSEKVQPFYLHLQILADYNTVEDMLLQIIDNFTNTSP